MKHKGTIAAAGLVVLAALGWSEPRGWLGVYNYELDHAMQTALGVEHGLIVREVVPGSPAATAGLRVGDVLVRVDSEATVGTADLSAYVGARPGQTVELELLRQGRRETLAVALGTRDRQLELGLPDFTPLREVASQLRPAVRNVIDDYLEEVKALRQEIAALQKDIERLRKELKKALEK
jgi:membrane-associated protease RseP (regulator of RpoE activity)